MLKKDMTDVKKMHKNQYLRVSIIMLGFVVIFGLGFAFGLNYAQNLYFKSKSSRFFNINNKDEMLSENMSFYYKLNDKEKAVLASKNDTANSTHPSANNQKFNIKEKINIPQSENNKNEKLLNSIKDDPGLDQNSIKRNDLKYTIQVFSFRTEDVSKRVVAGLIKKGYSAFISKIKLGDDDTFYRVRIGHFDNRAQAIELLEEIKRTENKEAFVTRD